LGIGYWTLDIDYERLFLPGAALVKYKHNGCQELTAVDTKGMKAQGGLSIMPTYEYLCGKCGVFEEFHSINQTLEHCPRCGGAVRRLISCNNNVIFKGSGFYSTDYRSGAQPQTKAADNHSGNHSQPATAEKSGMNKVNAGSAVSQTDSKAS
jgi:putative FmdB family regulatory protein